MSARTIAEYFNLGWQRRTWCPIQFLYLPQSPPPHLSRGGDLHRGRVKSSEVIRHAVSRKLIYKLLLLAGFILLLSLLWKRRPQISSIRDIFQICPQDNRTLWKTGIYAAIEPEADPKEKEFDIAEILDDLDVTMPKVMVTSMDVTTSGAKSQATLVNPKDKYCVGEPLHVRLDMYNHQGKRKTYGGDYLRPRIHSPELKASASGQITDFKNGTYLVKFTLFWEGTVQVSVLLMHPAEGVSALWRARNKGYKNIIFTGRFTSATKVVDMKCGFQFDEKEELCFYGDKRDGLFFYCVKPPDFPCAAFTHLSCQESGHSYLSDLERLVLSRSNIGVEVQNTFKPIKVTSCGSPPRSVKEKCKLGSTLPFPGGYFLENNWNPVTCEMATYKSAEQIKKCLQGKKVFLIGDSTLRQFILHFVETINIMQYFNHTKKDNYLWQKTLVAINMEKNIMVQWKKHIIPLISGDFYSLKEDTYIARQIDQIGGGENTIIILTMGQHFRPFPLNFFIRSALSTRQAIERLFYRSPQTTVIIKEENAREMETNQERYSDFHGHVQYLTLRNIFHGLNVGFVDALDMTIATAYGILHPPLPVLENLISMSLTYAC